MERLLEQAKATYDLVVIDTPPLTALRSRGRCPRWLAGVEELFDRVDVEWA
jgi:hypothetical protein